jgi:hypothetical protein
MNETLKVIKYALHKMGLNNPEHDKAENSKH